MNTFRTFDPAMFAESPFVCDKGFVPCVFALLDYRRVTSGFRNIGSSKKDPVARQQSFLAGED